MTQHYISSLNLDAGNINNKKLPLGARQIRNDYGTKGFGGACPPEGDNPHRYQLTVYALDTQKIELPAVQCLYIAPITNRI